jgi:uncharacterized protein (DUF885 family)
MPDVRFYVGVKDVKYPDGTRLYDVMVWNHFGTETAPPRPAHTIGTEKAMKTRKTQIEAFMSNLFMSGMQKNKKLSASLVKQREKVLLTGIGQSAVKETKDVIRSGSTVPNAPATVRKKGFDHPLYETELYLDNVDYCVE